MTCSYVDKMTYCGDVIIQAHYTSPPKRGGGRAETGQPRRERTDADRETAATNKSRRGIVNLVRSNCGPNTIFMTLTFDDDNLPKTRKKACALFDKFTDSLHEAAPGFQSIGVVGRRELWQRLHVHVLINTPFTDEKMDRQLLDLWTYGKIHDFTYLKDWANPCCEIVDGDYAPLGLYFFKHSIVDHERGKKRCFQTRNTQQPITEPARPATHAYSEKRPPPAPAGYEYAGCYEAPFPGGAYWQFKFVRIQALWGNLNNDTFEEPQKGISGVARHVFKWKPHPISPHNPPKRDIQAPA